MADAKKRAASSNISKYPVRFAGILIIIILVIAFVKVPFCAAEIRRPATIDFSNEPSDAQEAVIIQVLTQTAIDFGWDQIVESYNHVDSDLGWVDYHTELWGPVGSPLIPGMIGYHIDVPIKGKNPTNSEWVDSANLIQISTYPSDAEAKEWMNKMLATASSSADLSVTSFMGHDAIVDSGKEVEWQVGRFHFIVGSHYAENGLILGLTYQEIGETLHANAVKYGLIGGDGSAPPETGEADEPEEEPLEPTLTVSFQPLYFSQLGDTVMIQATLTGEAMAGSTMNLLDADTNSKIAECSTDTSGIARFTIEHRDPQKSVYSFQLQALGLNKTITVPVFEMGIQLEINPVTGEPYRGVTADGVSTLEIMIKLDGSASGELAVNILPALGELKGDSLKPGGTIELINGEAIITYIPPAYLTFAQLTRHAEIYGDYDPLYGSHFTAGWAAVEPIEFSYRTADGKVTAFPLEIEVYRPPVMMVHGFTGDRTTWAEFAFDLREQKFVTHSGEYYYLDQSVPSQATKLKENIEGQLTSFKMDNVKVARADLVVHSMGGLISRYYIGSDHYANNVRKLIMVGTPNHGCSWGDLQLGRLESWLSGKHKIAAEQLYGKSEFITTLNQGESMGLHLHKDVEYGNIYSYSAIPGFFSGDIVVPAASARLNGVRDYRVEGHSHSPAVSFMVLGSPPSITQSDQVFQKVVEWLTTKIERVPLAEVRTALVKAEGEVYIKYIDQFVMGQEIPKTTIEPTGLGVSGAPVGTYDIVGTGPGSKATLHFYTNDIRWGSISLDENTELKIGYLSPRLTEIMLLQGSARFGSLNVAQKGHYSVDIASADSRWQNVTSLNTDFVLTAGGETLVYSLEGDLIFGAETLSGDLVDQTINGGENYRADLNGEIVPTSAPDNSWWEDDFYTDSTSLLDQFSNFKIVRLLKKLLTLLKSDEPADSISEDNKIMTPVFVAALLALALMFALLIPLLKRKWFTVLAVLIIVLILVSSYLLSRLGWDKFSSLFFDQDSLTENVEVNQEPVVIPEETPEPPTEIVPEPETETSAEALNLEALIYNCRVLDLFGMSLDEIKSIIGNPDEEGWFAGDYYRWNDASSLIGNNENGIAQQSELFIAGSDIAMIRLDNFLSIREGSSFEEVRQLLGADLEVEYLSDNEWFEHVMVYKYSGYEFVFNASEPTGPVTFMMVRKSGENTN
jgi:hypothetical protein